jgi:hypothetical protein
MIAQFSHSGSIFEPNLTRKSVSAQVAAKVDALFRFKTVRRIFSSRRRSLAALLPHLTIRGMTRSEYFA